MPLNAMIRRDVKCSHGVKKVSITWHARIIIAQRQTLFTHLGIHGLICANLGISFGKIAKVSLKWRSTFSTQFMPSAPSALVIL